MRVGFLPTVCAQSPQAARQAAAAGCDVAAAGDTQTLPDTANFCLPIRQCACGVLCFSVVCCVCVLAFEIPQL